VFSLAPTWFSGHFMALSTVIAKIQAALGLLEVLLARVFFAFFFCAISYSSYLRRSMSA